MVSEDPMFEEDDDDDEDPHISRFLLENRFAKINGDLMIWWINKAAFFVMEMQRERDYIQEEEEEEDADVFSSESGVNMVGSTDLFCKIRDDLLQDFEKLKMGKIVGMVGIGKTALAKRIIQDPSISTKFERCIFLSLGPECKWEETLRAIIAQMPNGDKMLMKQDLDLENSVRQTLAHTKCLIVLDDFWDRGPKDIFQVFPTGTSQSAILFTSRLESDALSFHLAYLGTFYRVPFLNKEESWDLLRRKIFGENRCPYELEKAGKKIAENCEGLPLLILTVGALLSRAEKTQEYWSKVAANKTNSIFVKAYEQLSHTVYPSYYYLPQFLKGCFLYLGAFPQNDEVRVSRLISLWSADGFLGVPYKTLQVQAYVLSRKMKSYNVALETQLSASDVGKIKALSLHSVFWYVCKREARNAMFFHVLNSYIDASVQGIQFQRRISIYNNAILSLKDVRASIASISALHSLLCTGPYHQYEVNTCLGKLRLVKVLDALTIRFYEFPLQAVKLFHLRYLGLTCNKNLPPSISNLWGLRCLILHQHQSIKSSSSSHSYLPMEIWYLKDLEHLQIPGRNLPKPPPNAVLLKLVILLDVGAHTCSERVLESIPYVEKLRVQIELMPAEPCDDVDISPLLSLESLQFVVVNPELKFEIVAPLAFGFSTDIRKLSLSGFGYPMQKIATELPNLVVLKLKCYAFGGEEWQVKEGEFEKLKYLSMEDTDLVQWTGNIPGLKMLTIKNCYRLLKLPQLPYVSEIRVVDCNPSVVTWASQMDCSVYVECSWLDDGKLS